MGIKEIFKSLIRESKVITGEATKDRQYSSENTFSDEELAKKEFERSKKKLFDVNKWSDLSAPNSGFELYNHLGERSFAEKPAKGDFIKIDLPGPAPENWVKVIDIKASADMAEFTVSPSEDPREKNGEIEHFFIKEATSTFRVKREGKTIYGFEIGKNEGINNEGYEAAERELINTLIAEGGWAGFQEYQWQKVTDYYVHLND